ncbi:A-kinase anchor protein 9-like [Lucilia sericata]|uniref:A-kinase anchor protein 9-like n=1 Tax=Lucilia sericata TaxID=13632 RepID=UPI0018A84F36|nr:A-kinase anchor protein 9-like [Lucilia sericata]
MTKEANKNKTPTKKVNVPTTTSSEFDVFLKNQQHIVARLKTELKSAISKVKHADCDTAEKRKSFVELELSINQRDGKIHTLTTNLEQLKEENKHILMEFNMFKNKFCQLETEYDNNMQQLKMENEMLLEQLKKQETTENQHIQELSLCCQELQQKLQDNLKDFTDLNKLHKETLQNYEQMKINFEEQKKEFELYKNQVNEERDLENERYKLEFAKLSNEIREKDDMLQQCIADKNLLEKEKNLVIDGLNNKIYRIEKAFNQPTKVVTPMVTLHQQVDDNFDNNSTSESSNDNVAISKSQVRRPLEILSIQSLSNNENQKSEQNQEQRNYKFKRPIQPTTSSQQTNVATNLNTNNRKRRNQPQRPGAVKNYNEFSMSSSDDDSNYNGFSQLLWRPNAECYVPDTDASEGFAKPKRNKK